MKCRLMFFLCLAFTWSGSIQSQPIDEPIPDIFSYTVLKTFRLYSSTNQKQIYYIPRGAGVKLSSDIHDPEVDFRADFVLGTEYPFVNKKLLTFSGAHSTLSYVGFLKMLRREAEKAGYIVTPFPVTGATHHFKIKGIPRASKAYKIDCQEIDVPMPVFDEEGNPVLDENGDQVMVMTKAPRCIMPHPEKAGKKVVTNTIIGYEQSLVHHGGVNAVVAFKGVFMPALNKVVAQKMASGTPWSNLIVSTVKWEGEILTGPLLKPKPLSASTTIMIRCIRGGVGMEVSYNFENKKCAAAINGSGL